MAATTISDYSDALATQVTNGTPVQANLSRSNLRIAPFILTLASEASGTSFAVAKLPKGARLIKGELVASATLANSATLAVGLAAVDGAGFIDDALTGGPPYKPDGAAVTVGTAISDSTTCLKAAAAQGATLVPFCITSALGCGYELAKECWLTLTTGTGTVSTEVVRGHITYAVD